MNNRKCSQFILCFVPCIFRWAFLHLYSLQFLKMKLLKYGFMLSKDYISILSKKLSVNCATLFRKLDHPILVQTPA